MKTIIAGCGRVGSGLARALVAAGHDVSVIDRDPEALDRLGEGFTGTKIGGDALERDVLEQAGIRHADALAAATGSDATNAPLGRLAARILGVPRVVARICEPSSAEVYRRLGVQTVCPISWGIQRLAELIVLSELTPVASLGNGAVEILDVAIPHLLAGRPAGELERVGEARVVAITRRGETFLPASTATPLEEHDLVHLAVAPGASQRLASMLSA